VVEGAQRRSSTSKGQPAWAGRSDSKKRYQEVALPRMKIGQHPTSGGVWGCARAAAIAVLFVFLMAFACGAFELGMIFALSGRLGRDRCRLISAQSPACERWGGGSAGTHERQRKKRRPWQRQRKKQRRLSVGMIHGNERDDVVIASALRVC
jgi:hypothetical protein